jgi:NitT/TauT family transport system substrate-binding protein
MGKSVLKNRINRRDFLKLSFHAGGSILTAQIIGSRAAFGEEKRRFRMNVGYLPISDHLILPVSHALDNDKYQHVNIKPFLCRSWDELLGKVDMGILHAVFMLAPLAMFKMSTGSPLRCVLLGHLNGSVIAAEKTIASAEGLVGNTIGIPHAYATHRVLLYQYLKSSQVDITDDIKLIKVPPPLTVKKLKTKRINAYVVAEPWGFRGVNEGVAQILEFSKKIIPDHVCCLAMVKKNVIERHPAAVSEWVQSLQKAGEAIHQNPDQAGQIQKAYMHHNPRDIVRLVEDNIISYQALQPAKDKLSVIQDLALECGVLSQKCDLDKFVVGRFA